MRQGGVGFGQHVFCFMLVKGWSETSGMGGDGRQLFFNSAMQYYIAGRYAFFAVVIPVAGNLLHHAVEMSLKGALSKGGESLRDLRDLKHDLPRIWEAFKAHANDPGLHKFDGAVSALHDFEELRYPDSVLERGMQIVFSPRKEPSASPVWSSPNPAPEYALFLEDVDELFSAIFKAEGINPRFYTCRLREEAKTYLTKENAWWTV